MVNTDLRSLNGGTRKEKKLELWTQLYVYSIVIVLKPKRGRGSHRKILHNKAYG